jgi:hypothetical protein
MKIPTISQLEMDKFIEVRRTGAEYSPETIWIGSEKSLEEGLVETFCEALESVSSKYKSGTKSESDRKSDFEAEISPVCIAFFKKLPPDAKFSPGFWSYVSAKLVNVIEWRHPIVDKDGWSKNFVATHKPSEFIDGFLPRVIVRSLIAGESEVAMSLVLQDFWRSHILRVKTGFSKNVSIAFAEHAVTAKLNTSDSREFAKELKSVRSNVIFEALDSSQARKVIESLA